MSHYRRANEGRSYPGEAKLAGPGTDTPLRLPSLSECLRMTAPTQETLQTFPGVYSVPNKPTALHVPQNRQPVAVPTATATSTSENPSRAVAASAQNAKETRGYHRHQHVNANTVRQSRGPLSSSPSTPTLTSLTMHPAKFSPTPSPTAASSRPQSSAAPAATQIQMDPPSPGPQSRQYVVPKSLRGRTPNSHPKVKRKVGRLATPVETSLSLES